MRVQGKSAAAIVEEKNAFTLFLSGAYRTNIAGDAKQIKKDLTALADKIVKTAAAGGDAQAAPYPRPPHTPPPPPTISHRPHLAHISPGAGGPEEVHRRRQDRRPVQLGGVRRGRS